MSLLGKLPAISDAIAARRPLIVIINVRGNFRYSIDDKLLEIGAWSGHVVIVGERSQTVEQLWTEFGNIRNVKFIGGKGCAVDLNVGPIEDYRSIFVDETDPKYEDVHDFLSKYATEALVVTRHTGGVKLEPATAASLVVKRLGLENSFVIYVAGGEGANDVGARTLVRQTGGVYVRLVETEGIGMMIERDGVIADHESCGELLRQVAEFFANTQGKLALDGLSAGLEISEHPKPPS